MVNNGGKPRISRELMNRLNRHMDDGPKGLGAAVPSDSSMRPGLNSYQVAQRGRKVVGDYRSSAIGSTQAAPRQYADYKSRFAGSSGQSSGSRSSSSLSSPSARPSASGPVQVPKSSFREPPTRGYNPYS